MQNIILKKKEIIYIYTTFVLVGQG